jgi:hypothetical protein
MKQSELKKVLKPLIKECIKEVIFEEGVLSGLIKEVAMGLNSQQTIVEAKQHVAQPEQQDFSRQRVELQQEAAEAMKEKKRKLEESMGAGFKGVFDNVNPISKAGIPGEKTSNSPLSNYAPDDAGVDISGIMAIGAGSNWKNMI